uniref:Major facilitator superfamily (MFS) profile domain-containing protein n=1 Tax=Magallana gigas TaxID=29159 RepID=K1P5J4_MAGGI
MGGIEYAVILPTLWLYMKNDFSARPYFLGFVLSAFSFSALLFSPVIGRCADVFRRPKLLLILCTLWEIAGNAMYFMGISKWFLLGSRLVSGLGAGGEALILAEIGIILDMIALPFLVVCSISLFSKLTRKDSQGLSQGIRRSVVGVSCILAPLWAGSTIDKPYLMFGVMIGLLVMALTMLIISFSKLNTNKDGKDAHQITQATLSSVQHEYDQERQPLLSQN